jgi:hypothetical protein
MIVSDLEDSSLVAGDLRRCFSAIFSRTEINVCRLALHVTALEGVCGGFRGDVRNEKVAECSLGVS